VLDTEPEEEEEEAETPDEISLESLGESGLGSIEDVEP